MKDTEILKSIVEAKYTIADLVNTENRGLKGLQKAINLLDEVETALIMQMIPRNKL